MKRIILLLLTLLIITLPNNVQALIVEKNNLTIEKGNSKNINISTETEVEITEIQFTLVYTTYDIPAYFNIEPGLTDTNPNGINHKIVFSTPVSGSIKLGSININVVNNPVESSGTINIHSAKAITTTGETINLTAQTINVIIGTPIEIPEETIKKDEDQKEDNKNLLEKIESEIVNIELIEDVYEYTVKIKETIEELDLKAIPKDEKTKIEISTQKISELKNNQIVITAKNGDLTEEYKINISKISIEEVEIDNEEFESTYKYKGKWIVLTVIMAITLFIGLILTKKK